MSQQEKSGKQGTILIVAIWICLFLAALVLVSARSVRVQALTTVNRIATSQAEWIARGVLALLVSELSGTDGFWKEEVDISWEAVPLGPGYFWVLKPDPEDDTRVGFGPVREAAKINLNAADEEMLVKLPGMTAELAASIISWRGSQTASASQGAGDEYYLLLNPPYYCKRAPLETVEELLLIKDATFDLVFGEDTNRNGMLDPAENDGDRSMPADNADGHLDRGLYDFVTVYSTETGTGQIRQNLIDINSTDTTRLVSLLQSVVSSNRLFSVLERVRRERPFRSTLDFYFRTGLTVDEFKQIEPRITAGRRARQVGLVNVVYAPRQVLRCLPSLQETDVEALINKRNSPDTDLTGLAWVAEVLSGEKAAAIGEWITSRCFQFSADILTATCDGRTFKRFRAVIDGRSNPARVISFQDLTGLGWPLSPDILKALKAGQQPPATGIFSVLEGSK